MKLKYYMRGLGIGIILTTLIFVLGNNEKELTDRQIMERAKALGMEIKEENNENLEDILSSIGPTEGAEHPSEAPTDAPSVEPKASITPTATVAPTVTEAPTPTVTPTPTVRPTPTQPPQKSNQEGALEKISFTISKGMSSGKVAKLLVEKGLIKDADDFNKYIVKVGKAGNIRVGSYSIAEGTTYEDIVDIITSRQ